MSRQQAQWQHNLQEAANSRKVSPKKKASLPNWFYIFPAISFGLGTWQIIRWRRKKEMKRFRAERLNAPTIDLQPNLKSEEFKDLEFRKVRVRGSFDPLREFVIRPRTRDGQNGGLLITPFRRSDDGTIVLVNRGWIPAAQINDLNQRRAMSDAVQGETEVVGIVRPGENKGMLTPLNNVDDKEWYWIEVEKMQQALQLPYMPLLLDLPFSSAIEDIYPTPHPVATELRDTHLQYIATWFVNLLQKKQHRHILLFFQVFVDSGTRGNYTCD